MNKNLYFLTTPVYKIRNNLKKTGNKPPVVLLATGGFSPIHRGHLEMMEIAKKEMEKKGYAVIGGYVSPSHDGYIPKIYQGVRFLNAPHRLTLCDLAVQQSSWLMVDGWESRYNMRPILYPKVIARLKKYLTIHFRNSPPVEIIYVFGSDNADFIKSFLKKGICVCVRRKYYEKHLQKLSSKYDISKYPNIIISKEQTKDYSSSAVRLGLQPCISEEVDNRWKTWKKIYYQKKPLPPQKNLYILRDDIDWAASFFQKPINSKRLEAVCREFRTELINVINSAFVKCRIPDVPLHCSFNLINVDKQQTLVKKLEKRKKLLNLDLITESRYKLHLSRLYSVSNGQCHAKILVERPGFPKLHEQLRHIPSGAYTFIDDDIATGETRNILYNFIPKRIKITGEISLLDQYLDENKLDKNKLLDIVDIRDFLAGAQDAGLVVELPDGKIARAPYILPYVSLISRAKIPPSQEYSLSVKLWQTNLRFYSGINHSVKLEDTDPAFQNLVIYIGFNKKTPMTHVCRWHTDQLRRFL